MKTVLLLVDIQNDYFPGGKMELSGSQEAAEKAAAVLAEFRTKNLPVIHIQHIAARPGATFFLPGTAGIEFHESVKPVEGEAVFQKHFPNSFRNTPLLDHLRTLEIGRLVICGMMTHMCIDTTTRAAWDHGFVCTLIGNACATRSLSINGKTISAEDVHNSFLAALNGTFAEVTETF